MCPPTTAAIGPATPPHCSRGWPPLLRPASARGTAPPEPDRRRFGLAAYFPEVVATEASVTQVAAATVHPGVDYRVALAEASGLESASVDLVTVAQALHWFDVERFYAEVRRVLRPGGILAVWSYDLMRVGPAVDACIDRLHDEVAPFWPPERGHVASGYRALPFPFEGIKAPPFAMSAEWALTDLLGYLRTWSAVRRNREATDRDAVAANEAEFAQCWGASLTRTVRWPLQLRVGAVQRL